MSNRSAIFEAVRSKARPGLFNDAGHVLALDNLLDAFGVPRDEIVVEGRRVHRLADAHLFFDGVRKVTGALNSRQAETINALLTAAAHWPLSWLAYALATAHHEARLEPIHEKGGKAYLSKYDTGKLAAALGNTPAADGDGILYAGRGLCQITGRANYEKAGKFLGLDLLGKPDLALEPEHATRILVWGMESGAFTGKALKDYLPDRRGTHSQFVQARRIINGTDKADLIAGYADKFQVALSAGRWA